MQQNGVVKTIRVFITRRSEATDKKRSIGRLAVFNGFVFGGGDGGAFGLICLMGDDFNLWMTKNQPLCGGRSELD